MSRSASLCDCDPGFVLNSTNASDGNMQHKCDDIDECAVENGGCDTLATATTLGGVANERLSCINTISSFECGSCPTGFTSYYNQTSKKETCEIPAVPEGGLAAGQASHQVVNSLEMGSADASVLVDGSPEQEAYMELLRQDLARSLGVEPHEIDISGLSAGGASEAIPKGCDSVAGSGKVMDACSVCDGDNSTCADCADVPNGPAVLDKCSTCDSNSTNDCALDCNGVWGGGDTVDACGHCGGNGSSCADCAGSPNGEAALDRCNVCDSNRTNNCALDCNGAWGGGGAVDACGHCGGVATDTSSCAAVSGVAVEFTINSEDSGAALQRLNDQLADPSSELWNGAVTGQLTPGQTAVSKMRCPPGYIPGGEFCQNCPAGKRQQDEQCISCLVDYPDGYYAPAASAACLQCEPGKQKRLQDNLPTECVVCPGAETTGGMHSVDGTLCQACPPLMIPNAAQDDCHCPLGSYWAAWGRIVCHDEKFVKDEEADAWFDVGSHNETCVQCTGDCLDCTQHGGPWLGRNKSVGARIKSGYMMSKNLMDVYNRTNGLEFTLVTRDVHRCPGEERCIGEVSSEEDAAVEDCLDSSGSASGDFADCDDEMELETRQFLRCLKGSDGALCGACAPDYSLSALDNTCVPCDEWTMDSMTLFILLVLVIVGLLLIKFCMVPCAKKAKVQMDKMEDTGFITKGKIMISLSQVVSEMPFSLALSYPQMFVELLKVLGIFRIDLISGLKLDCLFSTDFYSGFIMSMLLIPIGLGLVQLPRMITRFKIFLRNKCKCRCKCLKPKTDLGNFDEVVYAAMEQQNAADKAFDRSFLVFFITYTGVTRQVFRMFDCRPMDDGSDVLGSMSQWINNTLDPARERFVLPSESWHRDDYATSCTTPRHSAYTSVALVMVLVFPLGVPGFMLFMLQLNRKWLRDPENVDVPEKKSWYIGGRKKFEFLVKDYKPEYYYWECVEMLRKLLLTGIIIFIDPGSTAQVFVACNISFFFFSLQMAW
eukprot:SAG22_NODE_1377_length_4550_cov_2.979555_2_plen_997_part_00